MKRLALLFAVVIGLALMLNDTSSGGPPPLPATCSSPGCNPTLSDANGNSAGGTGALSNLGGGFNNTAFGRNALNSNTTGYDNTASGFAALSNNTTGNQNTASGFAALFANTTGILNTASGAFALANNTTGINNTANGFSSLVSNVTGSSNTATGFQALGLNLTGQGNTVTGALALVANTTGSFNTVSGAEALNNGTGNKNTAVGARALNGSTGNMNIAIGWLAGTTLTNGNHNIYIGNQGAGDESQTIRMGTAQTRTFIAGINVAGVSGATVMVDGNGQLGIAPSSARYKEGIAPMGTRSEKVLELRPVTFSYKDDARAVTHYGLIAEEVATVYPDLVTRTASGEVQTVKYQELIPMLLNELQRQQQELATVRKELAELRAQGQGRGTAGETAALRR